MLFEILFMWIYNWYYNHGGYLVGTLQTTDIWKGPGVG